jgi:hypothetical protein
MRERTVVREFAFENLFGYRMAGRILHRTPDITQAIRKVHDFLTVGAANPSAARRSICA